MSDRAPLIRLHHVPESRSMRIFWLLTELGVPFDLRVWPFDRTLRSAQYLALNPAGRVPALELDGERLFESGALIEILCERFPAAGLGRAPGDPERSQWLIWVHFAETISQHAAALTQQHIALREDAMRSPTVMKLEAARIGKCY
ncbi:MAG: glutathione S-transferase N-terminal domain-containing protein, partial [Pseudomonadota bacterium]